MHAFWTKTHSFKTTTGAGQGVSIFSTPIFLALPGAKPGAGFNVPTRDPAPCQLHPTTTHPRLHCAVPLL
jgi:hypothetical protein